MEQRLIDTHIHIWDFQKAAYEWLRNDTSILKRDYVIGELETERSKAGVTEGILVQAANNVEDTYWMLEVAGQNAWIKGVVGWLPLLDPEATANVLKDGYARNEYFKGVRHMIHDEPDPRWLLQANVLESLQLLADNNLPYDIVGVTTTHLETALELAEKLPGLKMVFDHLNQPPMATKERFGTWGELMAVAATHKNFYAKISGLGTASKNFENWQAEDIKPYLEFVLEHFGEERCFVGGDWPVCLLAGDYPETINMYKDSLSGILEDDACEKVFYKNAQRFYNI